MKKQGILNAQLSYLVARMGHTDRLVICDSGLPIPPEAEVVDLALTWNIPAFLDTLRTVLGELHIEGAVVAAEMEQVSNTLYKQTLQLLPGIPVEKVAHEQFKELTRAPGTIAFVRTGEATSYANIMLVSGVNFNHS
ncbi:MAG TPA: D-ribose pyranase [bacterium]|nr:D-ribose pyranase [bacterium]HOH09050.1 D-ribose pyranase [bacterium]